MPFAMSNVGMSHVRCRMNLSNYPNDRSVGPLTNTYDIAHGTSQHLTTSSEEIFQRELHDSRVLRRRYLTKDVAVEHRRRIVHEERIRDVERLGSELQLLSFTNLECPGDGRIELPRAWTGDAALARISQRTKGRQNECRRIQVALRRFVAIRIRLQLIHALTADAVQGTILTGGDRHIVA